MTVRVVVTKGVPVTDEQGRHVCYVHPDTVRALATRGGVVPEVLEAAVVDAPKRRPRKRLRDSA